MSLYFDRYGNINRYFLEIEKYLPQLTHNPYLPEIIDDIYNKKKKKILESIDTRFHVYINQLHKTTIDNIFTQLYTKNNFKLLEHICSNIRDTTNINSYVSHFINNYSAAPHHQITQSPTLHSTNIRISTMTICCYLEQLIDLQHLYNIFVPPHNIDFTNYKKILPKLKKYDIIGCKYINVPNKGYFKKNSNSSFYNSASLNIFIHKDKQINFKIFKNGKIQITGIPEQTVAKECIEAFINYIYKQKIIDSIITYNNFRTVLINSDYFCGIEINRENLFKILTKKYNLTVSYESENYPGVKLAYFYNTKYSNTKHEGNCSCEVKCKGKGHMGDITKCKRITVAIFQSGKIIITGANSLQQIQCAYSFINNIIQKYYYFINKKKNIEIKTYKIKKKNIQNYDQYIKMLTLRHKHTLKC